MTRKVLIRLMSFVICVSILSPLTVFAEPATDPQLFIATLDSRPIYIDKLVYTAFKDIGVDTTFIATPLETGMESANEGERCGVLGSTPDIDLTYTNLIKVPIALEETYVFALARKDSPLQISNWGDLAGLEVGIVTQRPFIQSQIPQTATVITHDSNKLVLDGLTDGEYDVAILTYRAHETVNLGSDIKYAGQLDTLKDYLYLNKKFAYLIDDITSSLATVMTDGRGRSIIDDTQVSDIDSKKTILHIMSTNTEVVREEQFISSLRDHFIDDDSIEWYSIAFNAKRFSIDANRLIYFAQLLRQDCVSRDVSAIIVSGDAALEFLRDYYYLFFKNVPVLFYSIGDNYGQLIQDFEPYFTGIEEHVSAYDTVYTALSMFPDTKNIYVVNDYTTEGIRYKAAIEEQLRDFEDTVNIEYNDNLGIDALMSEIKNLSQDSIVLMGSYFRDAQGQYRAQNEVKKSLEINCSVPIFTVYSTTLGYNAIGGKCVDYDQYGDIIADMLVSVLNGESVSTLPILSSDKYNRWVFDKDLMDVFKIRENTLPSDSQIINKRPSIWESDPRFAYTLTLMVIVVIGLTISLYTYNKQKEHLNTARKLLLKDEKIKKVKERLETIINTAPVAFMISVDGVVVDANELIKESMGVEIGSEVAQYYTDSEVRERLLERSAQRDFLENEIVRFNMVNGEIHRFIANFVTIELDEKPAYALWGMDIEEREQQKDDLHASQRKIAEVSDRLERIIVSSPFLFFVCIDGVVVEANANAKSYTGVDIGEYILDIYADPTDRDRLLEHVMRDGIVQNEVLKVKFTDGVLHRCMANLATTDYDGQTAVVVWGVDIEQMETQKDQLNAAQHSLRAIIDTMPISVGIVDVESMQHVYGNKEYLKLFKMDDYDSFYDRIGLAAFADVQNDGTTADSLMRLFVESSEPVIREVRIRTITGRTSDVRLHTSPIIYEGRKSVLGLFIDLSAEKEYQFMQESLQAILDTLPMAVALVDVETSTLVYSNDACRDLFHYDRSIKPTNLPASMFLPALQRDGTSSFNKLNSIINADHPDGVDIDYITADGTIMEGRVICRLITYKGRKTSLEMIQNYAEIRELERTRQSLQTILDTMPTPISIIDDETMRVVYGNNSYLTLHEFNSPDDLYGTPVYYTLASVQSDGRTAVELCDAIIGSPDVYAFEIQSYTAKGNIIDLRILTSPISYKGKRSTIGVMTDLAAEKEYKRMQESLQMVLDMLPIPVRINDVENDTVLYINKATAELFGVNFQDDVYGEHSSKFMPPTQPDGSNSVEKLNSLNQPDQASAEIVFRKIDGEELLMDVTACLIDFRGNKSSLAIMKDLTAEKEHERMLLSAAEKEKEANQLKSRFLVNMSHEIRTPMNAIIGLTEIELRKDENKEALDIYRKINTSAKNLLNIINDILDLSKIEANKVELFIEEFEVDDVISSALLVATPRLDGKNVEFMLNESLELPRFIMGDRTRLWQILKNFLDNAAKYTEHGRIVLTVFIDKARSDDTTVYMSFVIEDTGIGIEEDQLQKLFKPYTQIYNEAQKRYTGTGLGMVISKQLCELMGGTMRIESRPGEGTIVHLCIPFKRSPNSETELQAIRSSKLNGTNILAVDDDDLSLTIMSNLLNSNNVDCKLAHSGEEALRIICEHRNEGKSFDLILLDYMMDGINGLETARQIQTSLSQAPKLLMVTAYQHLLLKQELEDNNIDDIIEKPFIPSQFINKIHNILGFDDMSSDTVAIELLKFRDVHVLLCEDYSLNYEVANGMFAQFGITSSLAENGQEGIDALNSGETFDLIFMDLQMPVMDGYEASRLIREDKRFDHIPIISLSADAMTEVVERCKEAGMNDHLSKPIEFDSLQKIFAKWLPESKRITSESAAAVSPLNTGVSRFGGNKDLYEKALREFAGDLPDEWPAFDIAVKDENMAKYIHKIKGAAGNLSEKDIYEYATGFEKSLHNKTPDSELYSRLTSASADFKNRVISLSSDNAPVLDVGTAEEFNKNLQTLSEALTDFDLKKSSKAIATLKEKTWPSADSTKLDELYQLMRNYDYVTALDLLDTMRSY